MSANSSDNEEENMGWLIQEYKKRKRKKNSLSQEDISEIIGTTSQPSNRKNTAQKQSEAEKPDNTHNPQKPTTRNFSLKMQEIINKPYKFMFYINTANELTRIQMVDLWNQEFSTATEDVILKTKKGFLLKTNTDKYKLLAVLSKLMANKKISHYKETQQSTTPSSNTPPLTFSAIISGIEIDIKDTEVGEYLKQQNITHRYCKRITSRATNRETMLIRFITGCSSSYQHLLNNGIFYKNRHYAVYPSNPPQPVPQPCRKCTQFDHTTENCTTPIKCDKCSGNHHPNSCTSTLPPKCLSCGSLDHKAWSFKCPNRPTGPIEGIPNTTVKPLNLKSQDIKPEIKNNTKIHSAITIHDLIINTYITKLNKPKNTNREDLLKKLKKRFIQLYNIDTTVAFSGNRIYILMFDLDLPNSESPTEPTHGVNNRQIHVTS